MRKNIGKAVSAPAGRERARGIRTGGARMSRVEIGLWQLEVRAKKCVEALRKNGFDAGFYPHAESLRTRVAAGEGGRRDGVLSPWGVAPDAGARGVREGGVDRVRGIALDPGFGDLRSPRGEGEKAPRPWPRSFREEGGDTARPAHLRPVSHRDERGHPRRVPGEPGHEREPDERDDVRPQKDGRGGGGPESGLRRGGGASPDQGGGRARNKK